MPYLPCKKHVFNCYCSCPRPRSGENVELVLEDEAATRSTVTLLVELAGMAHTQVTTQYKQIIKILVYFPIF